MGRLCACQETKGKITAKPINCEMTLIHIKKKTLQSLTLVLLSWNEAMRLMVVVYVVNLSEIGTSAVQRLSTTLHEESNLCV